MNERSKKSVRGRVAERSSATYSRPGLHEYHLHAAIFGVINLYVGSATGASFPRHEGALDLGDRVFASCPAVQLAVYYLIFDVLLRRLRVIVLNSNVPRRILSAC